MPEIAVVGCGIIGVTTAIAIQKKLPNSNITIISKDFTPNTTSDIAAGLWEPVFVNETSEEKIAQWSKVTYDQLTQWWREGKAKEYGICCQPMFIFSDNKNYTLPKWVKNTLGYQILSKSVVEQMSRKYNLKLFAGIAVTTFTWEASIALPLLQKEFTENGGKIVRAEVSNLKELSLYDVVVNCTGLQAKSLADDAEVRPIRGQIKKVKAPCQFSTITFDSNEKVVYIIPNTNLCTLGGTAINSSDISISSIDEENIDRHCTEIVPSLKSMETVRNLVGLRPGRSKVRIETEVIKNSLKDIQVVHNYGHGGSGITFSLGCAEEASDLVVKLILTKHKL